MKDCKVRRVISEECNGRHYPSICSKRGSRKKLAIGSRQDSGAADGSVSEIKDEQVKNQRFGSLGKQMW